MIRDPGPQRRQRVSPLDPGSAAHRYTLRYARDTRACATGNRKRAFAEIKTNRYFLPDFSFELLEPAIRAAVLDRLGFAARELGQPAYRSELVAAIQNVPGVDHVDVDVFTGVPGSLTPDDLQNLPDRVASPQRVVPARPARFDRALYTVPAGGAMPLTAVAAANGVTVARLLALNPELPPDADVPAGTELVVFRGIRPAQLVMFSADLPDTLILREAKS